MTKKRNIIYPAVIAILVGLLLFSHLYAPTTTMAQPGTAVDPLVTQSYVDGRIAQLEAQIAALQGTGTGTGVAQVVPFTPLRVYAGQTLIASAGAEIILRSGTAHVVAGPNGLVDVTAGRDIGNGQQVSRNHLLLVPATDGRGMHFTANSWLMIKGGFIIVQ